MIFILFLHVFSAYFGTIRQNKIGFSDDIQRIFSHKPTLVGIPLFNSAKIRTKGPSSSGRKVVEILIPPSIEKSHRGLLPMWLNSFMTVFRMVFWVLLPATAPPDCSDHMSLSYALAQ